MISTTLMLGVPAQIANIPTRILCTPPNANGEIDPRILYAAKLCGIKRIFKVGGAQAIAAMAFGTESIPKVNKIFGPGNSWVTEAKKIVAEDADGAMIDMPAGPSELMVIADDQANPAYVAADLLSQAEHGPDSQVILISLSEKFAEQTARALTAQITGLSRQKIIEESLRYCRFIVVDCVEDALVISNRYAPEHLMLQVKDPSQYTPEIKNAGSVFLGEWTPETVGDYVTGSNHVLPTNGYARSYSGLSVLDFIKFINFQKVTKDGLINIGAYAAKFAAMEKLDGHQQAVLIRLEEVSANAVNS